MVCSNLSGVHIHCASIGIANSRKSLTNKFFLCYISTCACVVPYVCFLHRAVTRVGTTADERRDGFLGASHLGGGGVVFDGTSKSGTLSVRDTESAVRAAGGMGLWSRCSSGATTT